MLYIKMSVKITFLKCLPELITNYFGCIMSHFGRKLHYIIKQSIIKSINKKSLRKF